MPVPYLSMLFTVPFPLCASKQHEYTSLNDQCLCQPKISRHSCAWRCSRNRTADISAEWNPGWNRLVCHESKRWSSSTSASSQASIVRSSGSWPVWRSWSAARMWSCWGPRSGENPPGRCPRCESGRCGPSGVVHAAGQVGRRWWKRSWKTAWSASYNNWAMRGGWSWTK